MMFLFFFKEDRKRREKWRLALEKEEIGYVNPEAGIQERGAGIRLGWFSDWENFGDAISPLIVRVLSGRPLCGHPNLSSRKNDFFAAGSIFPYAPARSVLWGSGCRTRDLFKKKKWDIRAVRGPLTRQLLLESGNDVPNIMGDPALLMPHIYRPQTGKEFEIGIVPHLKDDFEYFACSDPKIAIISVQDHPLKVIRQICKCRIIISSSLHGIIIAEAYGIPACWIWRNKGTWGSYQEPDFKYFDYYRFTDREPALYEFNRDFSVDMGVSRALKANPFSFDPYKLLRSFPFLRPDIRTVQDLRNYEIGIKCF